MEMLQRPNLGHLAATIHGNAVQHGFWEEDYGNEHYLMLVVCELAEAVEADRKGEKADRCGFSAMLCDWTDPEKQQDPKQYAYEYEMAFRYNIKDTVADELADTVIRLLDLAGARDFELYNVRAIVGCIHKDMAFTANVWEVVRVLTSNSLTAQERIVSGIVAIEILAAAYDIDLWWHVRAKMEYNASRPYKHNKKY